MRRPLVVGGVGMRIVGVLLFYGLQLNPADAQAKDLPGGGPAHEGAQVLTDAGITDGRAQAVPDRRRRAGDPGAARAARRRGSTRTRGSPVRRRRRRHAPRTSRSSRRSRRRTARAARSKDTVEAAEGRRAPRGRGRARRRAPAHARRHPDRGERVHRGRLRDVPVRPPLRDRAHLPAPDAGVPLGLPAAQGGDPEPRLARRRLRDHRLHLPGGARQRGDLGRACDGLDHLLDPADDLRVPLRALDGLRGLHAHPHARGLRRDRRHRAGRLARAGAHRQARDERSARAHVRLLRALDEPGHRHQAVRHRARRRDHLRRDRDPGAARPVDHAAHGSLELVAAERRRPACFAREPSPLPEPR